MINTKNRKMILLNLYSYDEENKSGERLQRGGGVVRTIKAQYYKNSLANFIRKDGLGATAVVNGSNYPYQGRLYSVHGVSPTLSTCAGGNIITKIVLWK